MARYIRTKDSVYELKENMTIENGVYSFFGKIYDTTEKHLFRNDKDLGEFVSQSENLEELCDMFVLDETHYMESDLKEMVLHRDCIAGGLKTTIYGAIWTEWGLKYIAKVNSKGELELL